MAGAALALALLVLNAALGRSACFPASNSTRGELEAPKASPGTPSTPGTPKLKAREEEVWSTHEDGEQAEKTQATTIQARRGRATSSPTKKVPRPCPGCFSVIGDPPMMQMG
ncbi:hypothetical protein GN956_G19500 [Arapaima gigas]